LKSGDLEEERRSHCRVLGHRELAPVDLQQFRSPTRALVEAGQRAQRLDIGGDEF
jgi:hypothetical protein